jgi:hypothetical protein
MQLPELSPWRRPEYDGGSLVWAGAILACEWRDSNPFRASFRVR